VDFIKLAYVEMLLDFVTLFKSDTGVKQKIK
jgi:hypothetical protein